ncbi:MAG: hypothetical protein QGG36_26415 [Pirellulaceae bacterium]|jgi:chemotaxis protein CheD|nr:hypothetical protein [Pirellulaceae bacterium]MDP7019359.1 hypothetical protein [Pirellulaceae bacterium]
MPAIDVACERKTVAMGEVKLARHPDALCSVLGSCIGVTIVHLPTKTGVFGHVVLPTANGRTGLPGKYADQAIPHMLDLLRTNGVPLPERRRCAPGSGLLWAFWGEHPRL